MRRCSPPSEYLASIVVLAGRIAGVEPHTGGPTPPQELPFRVIYMLTGTGKLNGLDPELYLRQVFERVADQPVNCIAKLLPWNLAAAAPAEPTHS